MKLQSLFFLCFSTLFYSFTFVHAQDGNPGPGNVTVYSEGGENFTLYLNGMRINESPISRVTATNVSEVAVSFRIVFENTTTPELTKRGKRQGTNCLVAVEKNKKGERVLRLRECTNEPMPNTGVAPATPTAESSSGTATPDQLSATYSNGIITINDGRTLTVTKVKVTGMTYPRVKMTAPSNAAVTIKFDNSDEQSTADVPFQYEVKDYQNNNAYFTLLVDEGGPKKTWKVKLQHVNGYDLHIE